MTRKLTGRYEDNEVKIGLSYLRHPNVFHKETLIIDDNYYIERHAGDSVTIYVHYANEKVRKVCVYEE